MTRKNTRLENEISHFRGMLHSKKTTWWGNQTLAGQARMKKRLSLIKEHINPHPGDRVLELGCGLGEATSYLASSCAKIVAIDSCRELVDMAKQKINSPNVSFCVADGENLPFADGYFSAVVGNSILHHLSLKNSLREIRRVLASGGKVSFCEPNLLNPQIMLERKIKFIGRLSGVSPYEGAFWRIPLKKTFENFGFSEVEIMPFDFLHPATPSFLISFVERLGKKLERIKIIREISGSLFIKAVRQDEDFTKK